MSEQATTTLDPHALEERLQGLVSRVNELRGRL